MGVERRCCLGCAKLEMTSYTVFSRETTVMWICITLALLQYNSSEHDVNQVCLASPRLHSSSDLRTPDERVLPNRDDRARDRAAGRGSLPSRDDRARDRAAGRGSL